MINPGFFKHCWAISNMCWWSQKQYIIHIMDNKKVRKLFSHRHKGFSYVVLTHSGSIHHSLRQYNTLVSFLRPNMTRIREKANLSQSKGCRGILKKQSCKSIIIMCQFWGIVVGDEISACNAPISFIEALTFLTSVKSEVKWSHSVVSDSLRPHGLYPTRILSPWDFPGKNTGVGCHFLLQNVC